ncbi:hypothetical protein C0992_006171 [Termitomyces sp. T32_za158]|nr:hypothetical protein C0992_006171 [Termitomyces sp. T32_za158]
MPNFLPLSTKRKANHEEDSSRKRPAFNATSSSSKAEEYWMITFPLEEGKECFVANKEIELDRPLTQSEYLSGRAFGSSIAPETPPVAALHSHRLKPRKPQHKKKHQTWDGDAYVSLAQGKLTMISEDGEFMGSVPWKGGNLSTGYRTMIGGREVELDTQVEASQLPHISKELDSGNKSPGKDVDPVCLASPKEFADQVSRFIAPVSFYGATVPKKSKGPL